MQTIKSNASAYEVACELIDSLASGQSVTWQATTFTRIDDRGGASVTVSGYNGSFIACELAEFVLYPNRKELNDYIRSRLLVAPVVADETLLLAELDDSEQMNSDAHVNGNDTKGNIQQSLTSDSTVVSGAEYVYRGSSVVFYGYDETIDTGDGIRTMFVVDTIVVDSQEIVMHRSGYTPVDDAIEWIDMLHAGVVRYTVTYHTLCGMPVALGRFPQWATTSETIVVNADEVSRYSDTSIYIVHIID